MNKGQCMIVHTEWASNRQAGWHHRKKILLSQQLLGAGFFMPRNGHTAHLPKEYAEITKFHFRQKEVMTMAEKKIPYKIYLDESEIPQKWYNLRADMIN